MRTLFILNVGLAMVALGASFALSTGWGWVIATGFIGLLWLTGAWQGQTGTSTMGLFFFAAAAAVGVILRLPTAWLLSSLVAALVAWDLHHFMHYLSQISDVRDKRALIKGHLWRLGIVAGLGWLLGVVALSVQITFDFIWALALGLLVITSLSGVIRYLRRESEQN
jgi:hypothetical protein